MPKDNPEGYNDLFGQFLMQAYLGGQMPGGQLSNFNTVLDLLSPGAVAGRQEAGVPDANEMLANMFGGTNLTPAQTQTMQEQQAGLKLTPGQTAEVDIAKGAQATDLNTALLSLIGQQGDTASRERVGMRMADIEEQKVPSLLEDRQATIAMKEAQTNYYDRMGKMKPADRVKMMELNAMSLIQYGAPINLETGTPDFNAQATPEDVMNAQALLKLKQSNPIASSTINAMLASNDSAMKELAKKTILDATGHQWNDGGWLGFGFLEETSQVENKAALEAAWLRLERYKGVGTMSVEESEAQQAEIEAQLGYKPVQ